MRKVPGSALAMLVFALAMLAFEAHSLLIVVTFPSLRLDVQQLVCQGDRVVSLVPPSVDPHEYQLKPGDIQLLKKADVIISTGHVPFEKRIEELVESHVVNATLVVLWRVPGVRLLRNPDTGQPDLHMPIYDPYNYIAFIKYLSSTLSRLNPRCASVYTEKARRVIEEVESLVAKAPRLNVAGVGDAPFTVYAVDWLGIHVEALLVPEPGLPSTPQLYSRAERLLSAGAVAVVTEPTVSKASRSLLNMAAGAGAPVIRVPSPLVEKTVPEKLEYILRQVEGLRVHRGPVRAGAEVPVWVKWVMVIVGSSLAFGALSMLVAARRLYFMAASLAHSSLLAATLAIPLAYLVGGGVNAWAVIVAVAATMIFYVLIERGIDVDIASSVFVAAAASASVAAMYYVLSTFPVSASLWAYILGDPLLVTMRGAILTLGVGVAALAYTVLTYRENVCIGIDPAGSRLAGLRVRVYDALTFSVLAASAVLLLRSVGFVVEHVLLLLPGAVAVTVARGAWRALAYSLAASLLAGLAGLTLALILGVAPAASIGGVMLALYLAALAYRRRA